MRTFNNDVDDLTRAFSHCHSLRFHRVNELLMIEVINASAKASIALQGAQISYYQPIHQRPILWCSDLCDYRQNSPLRGGIPICWPWFGNLSANPDAITAQYSAAQIDDASAHGFARLAQWQLIEVDERDDQTALLMRLVIAANSRADWPFACQLDYRIDIGRELRIEFIVTNLDSRRFHYSSALHSYFSVSHIANIRLSGLDQSRYCDTLDDWQEKQQRGDIVVDSEVDRIYYPVANGDNALTLKIQDSQHGNIAIASDHSASCVVWNPWIDKAKRLSQFHHNDYQKMLCIETAHCGDDFISLAPGQKQRLNLTLVTCHD